MKLLLGVTLLSSVTACGMRSLVPDAGAAKDATEAPADAATVDLGVDGCSAHCGSITGSMIPRSETCVFALPCGYGEAHFGGLSVFVDGTRIPRDAHHVEGWDYIDAAQTTVQVFGSACTDALAATVSLAQGC